MFLSQLNLMLVKYSQLTHYFYFNQLIIEFKVNMVLNNKFITIMNFIILTYGS